MNEVEGLDPPRTDLLGEPVVAVAHDGSELRLGNESELLLQRSGEGDRVAFRLLYDRHSVQLYSIALRITRDRHLASDALQDAFLQIWNNAKCYNDQFGTAGGWMIKITRYRALDAVRRRPPASSEEPDLTEASTDLSPLDQLVNGQALRACLERLSENSRRMVILSFVEGCSHPELANHLRVPLGTIKSTLRRSLSVMRTHLIEGEALPPARKGDR